MHRKKVNELDQQVSSPTEKIQLPRHQPGQWFLLGPIPGDWLSQAAQLPGKSLHVAMALWFLGGLNGGCPVKLTRATREEFGLSPDCTRRGLGWLEEQGLIEVERRPGCAPDVMIKGVN